LIGITKFEFAQQLVSFQGYRGATKETGFMTQRTFIFTKYFLMLVSVALSLALVFVLQASL